MITALIILWWACGFAGAAMVRHDSWCEFPRSREDVTVLTVFGMCAWGVFGPFMLFLAFIATDGFRHVIKWPSFKWPVIIRAKLPEA